MESFDYDLIVLGAGSGGVRASRLASQAGLRVAAVERSRVGGTCVMRGCVPKKLLVYGAQFARDLADARSFGWQTGEVEFNWLKLISAKTDELNRLETVYESLLDNAGVIRFDGQGILRDPHTVTVGDKILRGEKILIATGGRPALPDIPGIEYAITSNEALDLLQLPPRMVIVGGGYIAVEFASIFNALGVEVVEVLRADAVLRGFDEEVRAALGEELVRAGVDLRVKTVITAIERLPQGGYRLSLADGGILETDLVMYATGRRPNTDGLGLEAVGVATDSRGAVVVDEDFRTNIDGIFALGDVIGRVALTPVALAEAQAWVKTHCLGAPTRMDYDTIPTAVFSAPPVGTVGLTEAQARERFGQVDVYTSRFKPMRNTLARREDRTFVKMVVDHASDRVLGVHMVGADAPEIIQGFAVALKCGATKAQVDATIGIHPTAAEELVTLRTRRADPAAAEADA